MVDVELVIKIPERIHYGVEKGITVNGSIASQILIDAVKNGTPLPKEHGDLVDRDAINERFYDIYKDYEEAYNCSNQTKDKYLLDKLSMCLDTAKPTIKANYEESGGEVKI